MSAVLIGAAAAIAIRLPGLAASVASGYFGYRWLRRRRGQRQATRRAENEVDQLAQVLLIGLTAGLSLHGSLQVAADEVGGEPGRELSQVMRRARGVGLAAALSESARLTGPLMSAIAHAQLSGASAVGAVAAFLNEGRHRRRAASLEAARTLPVKLMLPLGLLILPGFILILAGPLILGSFNDLIGGLL